MQYYVMQYVVCKYAVLCNVVCSIALCINYSSAVFILQMYYSPIRTAILFVSVSIRIRIRSEFDGLLGPDADFLNLKIV